MKQELQVLKEMIMQAVMPACKAHSRTCDAHMPDTAWPGAGIRDVVFWRDMWWIGADGQACACMLLAALKAGGDVLHQ